MRRDAVRGQIVDAPIPARFGHPRAELTPEVVADEIVQALLEPPPAPALEIAALREVLVVLLQPIHQVADAVSA